MGSNTSKVNAEFVNRHQKNDTDNVPPSDPRSPTPEIVRTPLNNKAGSKHNITKNVDLRKTFDKGEEKLIHNNPILSAVIKNHLQSYDPRSPTQEFDRTPIVISKADDTANDEKMERLKCGSPCLRNDDDNDRITKEDNKNYNGITAAKNLCNGFFDLTLDDTLKDTDAPLGSSTASNDSIENNNSSEPEIKPKQLLETNFDYVETNSLDDSEENFEVPEDEPTGPLKVALAFKILEVDPRSPSIGIDRTPIVVPQINEETSEDNVEAMSDDTLIKVLQNNNAELKFSVNGHSKNPEGLLIYEDETADMNATPKKSKSACTSGSRTPLSCMKNKETVHARSKSANTDKELKSAKRVSHIPRLKSLSKQAHLISGSSVSLKSITKGAIAGDCENTPPNSHRDS